MKVIQFTIFILLIGFVSPIKAQFWKKITKKATQKLERKAEEKIDKETDKAIDKTIDDVLERNKNASKKTTKATNQTYKFDQSVTMQYTNKNTNETTEFKFFFNKNNPDILCVDTSKMMQQAGGGSSYMVVTPQKATMFMSMNGMKMKQSVNSKQYKNADISQYLPKDIKLKKTGNSAPILGYQCDEYTYNYEGATSQLWITKEVPINGAFSKMAGAINAPQVKGFTLEAFYKKGKDKIMMRVRSINTNESLTINSKEYKSFGM